MFSKLNHIRHIGHIANLKIYVSYASMWFKKYLYIAGMLLLFSSCVRNSEMQTEGAGFLQGVWRQDSIPGQEEMLQYTLHEIKFVCDSMYTTLRVHSKVKNIPDSCYKDGNWTEYAKGVYVVRADSIMVSGIYTRENGRQKVSGCYRQGQYLPRFKIAHQSPDSIVLESRYDQRLITLRKTEEVECVPKRRWEY